MHLIPAVRVDHERCSCGSDNHYYGSRIREYLELLLF